MFRVMVLFCVFSFLATVLYAKQPARVSIGLTQIPAKRVPAGVKIEKSGILVTEQFLEKEQNYTGEELIHMQFICKKKKANKISECKLIQVDALPSNHSSFD